MRENLERLLEVFRTHEMSEVEKETQRLSFAYGNANIENSSVTRAMVAEAAKRLKANPAAIDSDIPAMFKGRSVQ